MYRDPTVGVVAPVYNEDKLIGLGMSFIPVIETMPVVCGLHRGMVDTSMFQVMLETMRA